LSECNGNKHDLGAAKYELNQGLAGLRQDTLQIVLVSLVFPATTNKKFFVCLSFFATL